MNLDTFNNFPVLEKVKKIINNLKYKNSRIDDTFDNLLYVLYELECIFKKPLIVLYKIDNQNIFNNVHHDEITSNFTTYLYCNYYNACSTNKKEISEIKKIIIKFYKKVETYLEKHEYINYYNYRSNDH